MMAESKPTSRPQVISGPLALVLLILLLCLGFWAVYAGPALKKRRIEAQFAELNALLDGHGGAVVTHSSPHWLHLPRRGNLYLQWLFEGPLRSVDEWQERGGVPGGVIMVDLAKLSPDERRQAFDLIQRLGCPNDPVSLRNGTDADLEDLGRMPRCGNLSLYGSRITDAGLEHLAKLPQLNALVITAPAVTDAGLKPLSKLPQLRDLKISSPAVTDAGMKTLGASCPKLTWLSLEETAVGDAGLLDLASIKSRGLIVIFTGPKVTPAGIAAFEAERRKLGLLSGFVHVAKP